MPDMNENVETQQEYFGKVKTDNTRTLYNALNKIAELESQIEVTAKSKDLVINNQLEEINMLKEKIKQLEAQIEKMKCCGNCGNERCTSKYRGNSAYHRQADGFACADNEDWKPREIKEND